jgi:hypothetical protein
MVDPAGDGVVLLQVTIAMLTLSWVTLCARLAVRKWLKPEAMGADDYLMFAGLVGFPHGPPNWDCSPRCLQARHAPGASWIGN